MQPSANIPNYVYFEPVRVGCTAPEYLGELCRSKAEDAARSRLRSTAHGDLQVPRSKTNIGDRAFAVAGPVSLKRLPTTIRSSDFLKNF